MEKKQSLTIPLDYIRGLIVAQGGRCAISGRPLDPRQVNADHITPLSRTTLSPSMNQTNVWLVHKSVNAMKGTLTYDELIEIARTILQHHEQSMELLEAIRNGRIKPLSKSEFDEWVSEHCNADGSLKSVPGSEGTG